MATIMYPTLTKSQSMRSKRKSAVELLAESKPFYVKSEVVRGTTQAIPSRPLPNISGYATYTRSKSVNVSSGPPQVFYKPINFSQYMAVSPSRSLPPISHRRSVNAGTSKFIGYLMLSNNTKNRISEYNFEMSSSKSSLDDVLGESWVDISSANSGGTATPASVTQQLHVEDYLRLLREAQRESNQSSARVSLAGSRRDSPRGSPKSPPNSPVQGTPLNLEWQSYYLNSESKEDSDFFNDWSSRPDQLPPKNWSFRPRKRELLSIRYARLGNNSIFSRKGLCTLFLSNILSILLGTGLGLWISRHGLFVPAIKVR